MSQQISKNPILDNPANERPPLMGGVCRKLIKWVNGVPLPVDCEINISGKDSIRQIIEAAASLPYEGEGAFYDQDPELFGHSKIEVAMIRLMRQAAAGDQDAIKIILDRLMGKPEQLSKTVSVHGTYEDFLKVLAKKDGIEVEDIKEGEVVEPETVIDTSALG